LAKHTLWLGDFAHYLLDLITYSSVILQQCCDVRQSTTSKENKAEFILEYMKSVRIGQLQYFSQIAEDHAVRPWRTAGEQVLSLNQ